MELERGRARIYHCRVCSLDTPHHIKSQKGDMHGIMCTNCSSGALVSTMELRIYQIHWEEEMRDILDGLADQPEDDGPG